MEQFGPRPLSTNPVISQQFANLRVLDKKEECDVFEGGGGGGGLLPPSTLFNLILI